MKIVVKYTLIMTHFVKLYMSVSVILMFNISLTTHVFLFIQIMCYQINS